MKTEEKENPASQRKSKRKIALWLLLFASGLVLLMFLFLPFFVSSEKGRKMLLSRINNSINGNVDFSELSMSWFKGIKVTDVSFVSGSGDVRFGAGRIFSKPHYISILSGWLSFGETVIDEPKLKMDLQARPMNGNQQVAGDVSSGKRSRAIAPPIKQIDLLVNDGEVTITDRGSKTVTFSGINSTVDLRPTGQQTNFRIDMNVARQGKKSKVSGEGYVFPKKKTGWSLTGTSGDLKVEVNDLDLGSLEPLFALAGVDVRAQGAVSANLQTVIESGRVKTIQGTIKARDLDITAAKLKGDRLKSRRLDVDVKLHGERESINIEKLLIDGDWADVRISGFVPTTFRSLSEFLKPSSDYKLKASFDFDLAAVLLQMPRTFGLKEGMRITSGELSGDIEAQQGEISSQANLVDLAGIIDGKEIVLSEPVSVEIKIMSDNSGITFKKIGLSASFAEINCGGGGGLINYDANVDLEKLQAELGQFADFGKYRIAGEVSSKGEISGSKEKITVEGSSVIKNLHLSSSDGFSAVEPQADMDFSVSIEPEPRMISISSAQLDAGFGQITTKSASFPLSKTVGGSMNLPILVKVDLQKIRPFLVLLSSFPPRMQLSGAAEGEITLSSKKDSYRIFTDNTKIKNLKVDYPERAPFEQEEVTVSLDGEFSPTDKTINVRKLEVLSPQIRIEGDFQKVDSDGKTKLQGNANLEYSWDAVSTIAGPFLPFGLQLQGQMKDEINFSGEYPIGQPDQLPANLNTKAKIGFEKAEYMGLTFEPTKLDIQVQDGLLKIAPFSTTVNNGQLNFACEADFNRKPTLLKTPGQIEIAKDIQINREMSQKLLMYLNPIFASVVNVSGVMDFDCEQLAIPISGGSKEDIVIAATVAIRNLNMQPTGILGVILSSTGAAKGQDMTIHPTAFSVKNGYIHYDNMQLDIGETGVNFSGTLPLDPDERIKDLTIALPYTSSGEIVKLGKEISGRRITVPIEGTLRHPELDLGKLLKEQAIQTGLELLFEQLQK